MFQARRVGTRLKIACQESQHLPARGGDADDLAQWYHRQMDSLLSLTEEQQRLLHELAHAYPSVREFSWEEMYQRVCDYYDIFGRLPVEYGTTEKSSRAAAGNLPQCLM